MRRFYQALAVVAALSLAVFACAQIADGLTSTTNINIGDTRIIHCRNNGVSVVAKDSVTDGRVSCVAPTTSSTTTSSTTTTTTTSTTTTTTLAPPVTGWPGSTNTGWQPTGVTLTNVSGNVTLSTAGQTYDSRNVSGNITVTANNVTISRSRVTGMIFSGGTNLMVVDTEIGPSSGTGADFAMTNSATGSYTCLRCNVHNTSDGFRAAGVGVRIEDTWIHNLAINPGDHADGIQRYDPGRVTTDVIRHNFIDCVGCTTSPIFYADNWRGTLVVDGNWTRGGGYGIRIHESGFAQFTNNKMTDYGNGPCSTSWWPPGESPPPNRISPWSGNTNHTGATVAPGSC